MGCDFNCFRFAPDARVRIAEKEKGAEMTAEEFLSSWKASEDRYPPASIRVRKQESLPLCISTEYWSQVGGPQPYHDTFTYSAYSNEDISERLMQFLRDADAAAGWDISSEVLQPPVRKLSLKDRVGALFRRGSG